jgi:chromosome segregation protein
VRCPLLSLGSQPLIKFCPRAHLNLLRDPDPHKGNMPRTALLRRVGGINDWQSESARLAELGQMLTVAQKDLRVLETLRLSGELERAQRVGAEAKDRLARTQERFSRARRAEAIAQALHDAARRGAGETLDRRLERVLPLMSELYPRLRPHAIWRDIEYSIRGDVKRFLKLQVGQQLNPQFLFSSGQRRATGLAFLLSVNISLAWSRWRSILLDDPVQHVDDFRTVHLAEVLAQLVSEGRQIICAVEDAALADLLCRRLPISKLGEAKRVTLGPDGDGALGIHSERQLKPLVRQSLLAMDEQSVAS